MKKICILSAVNIKHMSLISLYTEELTKLKIEFDIIYMDKYNKEEYINAKNIYRYVNIINPKTLKFMRGLKYFKFINYAKKILEKNKYDFIIVWNDVAILLFANYLRKKWAGKYCLNIRDYFYQKNIFVYNRFKKVIENAAFTTLSSSGYTMFLPKRDYVYLNSFNKELLSKCTSKTSLAKIPLRLSFIGNVRFFEENYKLIDALKNDNRYELHYHGTNSDIIEKYIQENNVKNVVCSGSFPINDTKKYLENSDIINNVFGNSTIDVKTLTSIRLYHAAYMKEPILVSKNSHMEKIAKKYKIGYSIDLTEKNLADELYQWYMSINFKELKENCDKLLDDAEKENFKFVKILKKYVID